MVDRWHVAPLGRDAKVVLNELGQPLTGTTYRIPALSGSIHVEVTFREIVTYTVEVNEGNTDTSFEVIPGSHEVDGEVMEGAAVVFTVTPESGYGIASVSVLGNSGPEDGFDSITREADGSWACVVAAVTDNLVVTAEATELYAVTVPDLPVGGSIMISAGEAIEGTEITLAATPASNYRFDAWSVTQSVVLSDASKASTTFIMPPHDVEVGATFTGVSPPLGPPPVIIRHDLTVAVQGQGSTNPAVGVHPYSDGAEVTVRATPAAGWILA